MKSAAPPTLGPRKSAPTAITSTKPSTGSSPNRRSEGLKPGSHRRHYEEAGNKERREAENNEADGGTGLPAVQPAEVARDGGRADAGPLHHGGRIPGRWEDDGHRPAGQALGRPG